MVRIRYITATALAVFLALMTAAPLVAQQQAAETPLPVQRVVLYKSGIGYFEHLGRVAGDRDVTISFTSAQLDDVLKTLTVLDLDGGRVTDIGYNSLAPLEQRLRNVRLPIGVQPTFFELLTALRGARVEVRAGDAAVTGRVLSAERHQRRVGDETRTSEEISIVTDAGEVRRFAFGPDVSVRLLDEDLRQEMVRYLTLLESTREEDVRRLTIATQGNGERDLFVSYVSEVPIWKSSYRIVMPEQAGEPVILQGWAIVDNTVGEDWDNVELSLVGGAPQSFIQAISQPYYARRPVVPLPEYAQSSPQTHAATLTGGSGRLVGLVVDPDTAPLPGVQVSAIGPRGEVVASTSTRISGEYSLGPLPAGTYTVRYALDGFVSRNVSATVGGGGEATQNVTLSLGSVEETLTVTGESPVVEANLGNVASLRGRSNTRRASGFGSEAPPQPAAGPVYDEAVAEGLAAQQATAGAQQLGDLVEYRITDPVTIPRNQSALVPILRAEVSAERVSLWSQGRGAGRPLRALWLTNDSDLSLDGGSFTVLQDSAFAGEGLLDAMEPGEKRLLSYGTDVAMQVDAVATGERGNVTRVMAQRGVLIYETSMRETLTYTLRNEDAEPRSVIIEHPNRPGWEIVSDALPEETSPGVYRFRASVDPGETTTLAVAESRPVSTRVSLTDVTPDHIAMLVQEGVARAELQPALEPILDKKAEIVAVQAEIGTRRAELGEIDGDQQRVRANIEALGSSVEERALVQRYVQQLEQQEDRLQTLRAEIAAREAGLQTLYGELQDLIENLSFEIDPAR